VRRIATSLAAGAVAATTAKVREAVGVPVSSTKFKKSRAGKKFMKLF
jgi:hypothetical protein